jgi:hypothetical protein
LDDTKLKLGGCHQREFAADGGAGNGRPPVHRTLQGIDLDLGAGASLVEMDAEAVYPLPHRITYMEITDAAGAIIDEWSCCKAPLVVCTPSVSLERCSRRRPRLPQRRPLRRSSRCFAYFAEHAAHSRCQSRTNDHLATPTPSNGRDRKEAGSDKAAARLQSYPTYSDVVFYIARPIVMQA